MHLSNEGRISKSWFLSSHCAMAPSNLLSIGWINTIIKFLLFDSCAYVNIVLFHIHLLHLNIHHIETLIKPYPFPSRVQLQLCKSHERWENGLQRCLNITFHTCVQHERWILRQVWLNKPFFSFLKASGRCQNQLTCRLFESLCISKALYAFNTQNLIQWLLWIVSFMGYEIVSIPEHIQC